MITFRVLGPLEIDVDGVPLHLGGPREQTVLAMLLLGANRVVPIERLMLALWDDRPPNTARSQVQICISILRKQLMSHTADISIESKRPGYLIRMRDELLDMRVFEAAVASAKQATQRDDLIGARNGLRKALELWRGNALAGIDSRIVQQVVSQLAERRLVAIEDCLDIELQLGMHQEVAADLVSLVEEHPLRERLRALLMMALYGAGRQAEALDVYRRAREALVEELGIEPGAELRRLQAAILNNSSALGDLEAHAIDVMARTASGAQPIAVPRLLPATIRDFTGRADQVVNLVRQVLTDTAEMRASQAVGVNVIVGRGGTGKTTLAVHVAHQLADQFPDGQLFVRLRAGNEQISLANVFERFLRAFGISSHLMPEGIEERAEMYRNILARRRVLILLDDVMSEQQVRDLIPGTATCAVIVTSRKRLTGLSAANRIELKGFEPGTAIELLGNIIGSQRMAGEPTAVSELCEFCDHIPLALRIVGARLAARPHWTVADMTARLVDESKRLDELSYEQMGVRASISLSYVNLSPIARCMLRRLALLEASSFASWVGGPLIEVDELRAQDVMDELVEAYFLDTEPGLIVRVPRYRLHDITRIFAHERLTAEENPEEVDDALARYIAALHYLTREAHKREYGGEFLLPKNGATLWPMTGSSIAKLLEEPIAWLDEERASIVWGVRHAANRGLADHSWGLALSAVVLFEMHMCLDDWRETHEDALRAVMTRRDARGEAAVRYSLGSLHMFSQNIVEAEAEFERALALFRDLGDEYGTALVLRNVAYLDRVNGRLNEALDRWGLALPAFRAVGDRLAEAHVLHNIAQVKIDFGELEAAATMLDEAEEICTTFGNRRVGAQVLHRKGELYLRLGDLDAAMTAYRAVLEAVRESADLVGECYALLGVSAVHVGRMDLAAAGLTLARAQELAAGVGDPMIRCRVVLAQALVALDRGDLESAALGAERAMHDAGEMSATLLSAKALLVRGRIYLANGEPERARAMWGSCAELMAALDRRVAAELATELDFRISALPEFAE